MFAPRHLATLVIPVLGLISLASHAQSPLPTRTELTMSGYVGTDPTHVLYGDPLVLTAKVFYGGPACASPVAEPMTGELVFLRDGVPFATVTQFYRSFYRQCADGNNSAGIDFTFTEQDFAHHEYSVEYLNGVGLASSVSNAVATDVQPLVQALSPLGNGVIKAGTAPTGFYCSTRALQFEAPGTFVPPPGTRAPYGAVRYDFTGCHYECGFLCPPGTPSSPEQWLAIQVPDALPPTATLWSFPLDPESPGTWSRLATTFQGPIAKGLVRRLNGTSELHGRVVLSPGSTLGNVQDMWWAGPAENGWGLSIAQSGEGLFVAMYIYGEDGSPEWLVMPLGSWNLETQTWTGMLYQPRGSWFGHYDPATVDLGIAVGQASIAFSSESAATLDYTIRGVSGRKSIARLPFGSPATPSEQGPRAGLWRSTRQGTGWGLAIGHQGVKLFSVWYTYAKDGTATWFVMPGGQWTSMDTYSGPLYRTSGKSFLSQPYDPAQLKVHAVGTMTLNFTGPATANMTYSVDGTPGTESISLQPF